MADSSGEKTLKPTQKRLRDARRRGQVARSRDLASASALLAATGVLSFTGAAMLGRLQLAISNALGHLDAGARSDTSVESVMTLIRSNALLLAMCVGPVALAAGFVGVAAAVSQGGLTLSAEPLQPQWSRLSPATGLQRLAPKQAGIDTLKAIVCASIVVVLAWRAGRDVAWDAVALVRVPTASAASRAGSVALRFLWQAGGALLAIGVVDYAVQRWRLTSSLKMTRHEVQEDARLEEGRPEVRARVRRIQRDMARRRMAQATAQATVVVTNPTHYAVALEYRRERSAAPVVVAKGRDLLAGRIREIARANDVPIIENPPLARALYAGAEVGDVIPVPLFGAVAEVLAYLVRARRLRL